MSDPNLSRLPLVKAPDKIWNSIETALDAPPAAVRRRQWWIWVAIPATALLLLLAVWSWNRIRATQW